MVHLNSENGSDIASHGTDSDAKKNSEVSENTRDLQSKATKHKSNRPPPGHYPSKHRRDRESPRLNYDRRHPRDPSPRGELRHDNYRSSSDRRPRNQSSQYDIRDRSPTAGGVRRDPVGRELGSPPARRSSNRRTQSPASVISSRSAVDDRQRGYPQYPDQYRSRHAYDQQAYYYYYQKYLEHPYYRDYYRQYYGRYGYPAPGESFTEDKVSTRSGRSSVNEEMKKSVSSLALYDQNDYYYGPHVRSPYDSHFQQDFHGGYEPSSIYADNESVVSMKRYTGAEFSGVASDEHAEPIQRLTPAAFNSPHLVARFSAGGKLVLVLPNDPKDGEKAVVQIREMSKMLSVNKIYRDRMQNMSIYPGPLTYNDTHKDVVIKFCDQKVLQITAQSDLNDGDSQKLLWQYLGLLVKHNGKVCGADLAGLLIQNKVVNDVTDESVQDNQEQTDQTKLIKQFTEYLCLGRKKEAVEYAIREKMWGYAMTLAAKMDSVTHSRVMTAFVNSIPHSDPLQTLIQHLSGKRPEVTKNFSPDKWGDWKEHLALLVSNPTGQLQRDRNSIITLGDTLLSRNQIHAAHLCYLAADVEFGCYSEKSSKIVLLGASHKVPFQNFFTEDAFQYSEVYEYAKSLELTNPLSPEFQWYKYVYALRLSECGYVNEALKYCEVIASVIAKNPVGFEESVVSQVFELGSQLKYHDVHYQMGQGEISEMSDPDWLQSLYTSLYMIQSAKMEKLKEQQEEVLYQAEEPIPVVPEAQVIEPASQVPTTNAYLKTLQPSPESSQPTFQNFEAQNLPQTPQDVVDHPTSQLQEVPVEAVAEAEQAWVPQPEPINWQPPPVQSPMPPPIQTPLQPPMSTPIQTPMPAPMSTPMRAPVQPSMPTPIRTSMPPHSNYQNDFKQENTTPIQRTAEEEEYWNIMRNKEKRIQEKSLKKGSPKSNVHRRVTFDTSNVQTKKTVQQVQDVPKTLNDNKSLLNLQNNSNECESQIVFGGTYPIDAPMSLRDLGKTQTYQVDEICCSVTDPCTDHLDKVCSSLALQNNVGQEVLTYPVDAVLEDGQTSDYDLESVEEESMESYEEEDFERGKQQSDLYNFSSDDLKPSFKSMTYNPNPNNKSFGQVIPSKSDLIQEPKSKQNSTSSANESSETKKSKDGLEESKEGKSGFFGSIFSWKKSNQAKLPDDSNPTIVWDENKKKWVNSDGDDEVVTPTAPPPSGMAPPPSMGGTFRGGSKMSRYVDPVVGKPAVKSTPRSGLQPSTFDPSKGIIPQDHTPTSPSRLVMTEQSQDYGNGISQMAQHPATGTQMAQQTPSMPETPRQPTGIPQMVQQPTGMPQMAEQPTGMPQIAQQPTGMPQMAQQPTGMPQMAQQPTGMPQMAQQPTGMPQMAQQPTDMSHMAQQQTGIPQMAQQQTGIPQMAQQQTGIPQMAQQPTDMSHMAQQQTGIPQMAQQPTGMSQVHQQPSGMPQMSQQPQSMPYMGQQPSGMPQMTPQPSSIPHMATSQPQGVQSYPAQKGMAQITRMRYNSESSSVDLQDVDQGSDPLTPVPMMGAPPMFNPSQFSKPTGPSAKKGPARRSFVQ